MASRAVAMTAETFAPRRIAIVDKGPIDTIWETRKVRALTERVFSRHWIAAEGKDGITDWFDKHEKELGFNDELNISRPIFVARDSISREPIGAIIAMIDSRPEAKMSFFFALPEYGDRAMIDLLRNFEWWAASSKTKKVGEDKRQRYKIRKHVYKGRWEIEIPVLEKFGYYNGKYKDPVEAKIPEEKRVRQLLVRDFRKTYWPVNPEDIAKPIMLPVVEAKAPKIEAKLRVGMPVGKGRRIELRVESNSIYLLFLRSGNAEGERIVQKILSMIDRK